MTTEKQQKINRDIWYEALLSGKYKQCTGTLHHNGGHCCLGVADLVLNGDLDYPTISKQLGITEFQKIYKLNDLYGMSFEEIANLLKNNEVEYFNL